MSSDIFPIIIDKETVSDDIYIIVKLYFCDGDKVQKGDIIISFETSKAVNDIESPLAGYVFHNVEEGQEIAVGTICAAVSLSHRIPDDYFDKFCNENVNSVEEGQKKYGVNEMRVSKAAKRMLEEHNIDISVFKERTILRAEDINLYLAHGTTDTKTLENDEVPSQNKIIIIGGGGHATMCIDIIRQMKTYSVAGTIDANSEVGATTLDVPVIGGDDELETLFKKKEIKFAAIGIGALHKPIFRQEIYNKLKRIGYLLPNLIHPKAIIEPSANLGEGNQIMAGAIIGSGVRVGNNCIINSGSIISHDCILHDNVHITPGAVLAGMVKVGSNTIIGMGATVLLKGKIGSNVIVPNGMDIIKDIPNDIVLKKYNHR